MVHKPMKIKIRRNIPNDSGMSAKEVSKLLEKTGVTITYKSATIIVEGRMVDEARESWAELMRVDPGEAENSLMSASSFLDLFSENLDDHVHMSKEFYDMAMSAIVWWHVGKQ